jgi:hypothetical protein
LRVVTRRAALLETPAAPVDTVSMRDSTELPTDQQDLICILAAYQAAQHEEPAAAAPMTVSASAESGVENSDVEEETGWIPRLKELPGIAAERLAPLHGLLIAHGLLRFNLLGRSLGVGYRVTPEGRDVLARFGATSASTA